jgi:hypothetical protein
VTWKKLLVIAAGMLAAALVTVPIWGMGPAVFLDSQRTVMSRHISPNGDRVAQVERIIVGGAPSVVVMVRSKWMPDWYLLGCSAASHYGEAKASVRWVSTNAINVIPSDKSDGWRTGSAPFHHGSCDSVSVSFHGEGA